MATPAEEVLERRQAEYRGQFFGLPMTEECPTLDVEALLFRRVVAKAIQDAEDAVWARMADQSFASALRKKIDEAINGQPAPDHVVRT